MTIIEMLSLATDNRSKHGRRHQLSDVLVICILAIMSGNYGYREIGRFANNHAKEFQKTLRLMHKVPSYVTIRAVLQGIDFDNFNAIFNQWAMQFVPMCKKDTKAIDGKAIASTIFGYDTSYQNFVSLITVFSSQRGIVIHSEKIESKKESEIPTVQQLIRALDIEGEIFTLDALHCQKKRHLL